MSRFSGKCDLYDLLSGYEFEDLKNWKIYRGSSDTPIKIEKEEDLIPYYPFVCSIVAKDASNGYVRLMEESWIDHEERKMLELTLQRLIRYFNSCKRKDVDYEVEDALEYLGWLSDKVIAKELALRVKEKGKKATIEGLHLRSYNYYREKMVEELQSNGLNPVEFGYAEFIRNNTPVEKVKKEAKKKEKESVVTLQMTVEEKNNLDGLLKENNLTLEELTCRFLQWIIRDPKKASEQLTLWANEYGENIQKLPT